MSHDVLVSVIMPTYNCGKFIAEAIDSVLAQSMTDWEIQIVDDCSTDNTQEIVGAYQEKHQNIHYYRLPENSGPAVARTEAMKRAKGKYIAFLDSDDRWHPEKLEKQIRYMTENNISFSCTAYGQMDEAGKELPLLCIPPKKTNYQKMLRLSNPIGNSTVMYDRTVLGDFEVPVIKKRNDFALWLQILKKTPYCGGIDQTLAMYRVRSNSVSSRKLQQIKYHWYLYHEIEKLGFIRSCWYVFCWAFVKGTGIGLNRKKRKNSQ